MKYLKRNIDMMDEDIFYEDQTEAARKYWEIEEDCESIEDVAMWWNMHHSGDAIGELIVKEINA